MIHAKFAAFDNEIRKRSVSVRRNRLITITGNQGGVVRLRFPPHIPGGVEHVVLSTGRALVGVADEPVELHPGDYVAYPGDLPHIFNALAPDTTAVLLSEHV